MTATPEDIGINPDKNEYLELEVMGDDLRLTPLEATAFANMMTAWLITRDNFRDNFIRADALLDAAETVHGEMHWQLERSPTDPTISVERLGRLEDALIQRAAMLVKFTL